MTIDKLRRSAPWPRARGVHITAMETLPGVRVEPDLRGGAVTDRPPARLKTACPVTGKSAHCRAADLRGPDWMAKLWPPVVVGAGPRGWR